MEDCQWRYEERRNYYLAAGKKVCIVVSAISFSTGKEKKEKSLPLRKMKETINVLLFPSAGLQDVNYIAQRISLVY